MGAADPPERPGASLFTAHLADPRQKAALPHERKRGRTLTRAEPTSDVTRFRGVLAAAVAGAAVAAATAILVPPTGGHLSPGPLSRPHALAKLECGSCHAEGAPRQAGTGAVVVASSVCTGCHGAHPSTRPGHRRATETGAMRCATCHPIHRSDQGVVFPPSGPPIRFAPGVEKELALSGSSFVPARSATVALPTAGSCRACHDLGAPRDPIARCLLPGQEALGDARPVVCFDEHQEALPSSRGSRERPGNDDASRPRAGALAGGVCAGQHGADRAAAWDAAREVAGAVPVLAGAGSGGAPWMWLGAGLLAAALAFAGVRTDRAFAARRRRKAAVLPADSMLRPAPRIRLPQIDPNTCLGCYACVDACPYDVLEVERYVAVVVRPEACCGLTLCEQRCPNGSLVITDGDAIGDRPRLSDDLESADAPGLYLAGDITGLPLIKNAIHQGAHAVTRIAASLRDAGKGAHGGEALDLIIVGAGPAGISAALRAKELGLRFEVIEQGDVAQSIQSFPRGKLVFDQPLELPVTGKLWLRESTKEELLSHWLRIVRQERLPIRADTRMTGLTRDAGRELFTVTTEPREGGPATHRLARRVLLSIGQRGSPRRLPFELSQEVEARVHYHLADARSFEGQRVVVVGLGDVAMEAAIALGRQPGTEVTVVHRGEGFNRGKARNIAEVKRMRDAGRIAAHFRAEVAGLDAERMELRTPEGTVRVGYDAVLVLIGSIPPSSTLQAAGVRTAAEMGGAPASPGAAGSRS
jgi:thioredoxin reductase